ncbi:MAG TPA: DUF1905 domain-containing protein [Acidimicrobiia bacterium]|nr:DUF1905 domain-containing protein [Acidimicrobiia bacterium]
MYSFGAELWLYDGDAAWHFVTLPGEVADDIRARTSGERRGFGSVRVEVTVGATAWSTSIFPDRGSGNYVLPVKREVREAEGLEAGDVVEVALRLADGA